MPTKNKATSMPEAPASTVHMNGNLSGQLAVGSGITQTQTIQTGVSLLTEREHTALSALIEVLKEQVEKEATPEQKAPALAKVAELEQSIATEKPNISTFEHVRDWFVQNIPQLAGTVTGLIVNPIVGKLVEAAGETIAHEFKLRFGTKENA